MLKLYIVSSLLLATQFILVDSQLSGTCLDIEKVHDFSYDKFLEHWFEYAATPAVYDGKEAKCGQFLLEEINPGVEYTSTKTYVDVKEEKMKEKLFVWHPYNGGPEGDSNDRYYGIIDTDYTGYAVLIECDSSDSTSILNAVTWIRDDTATDDDLNNIKMALNKIGYTLDDLKVTSQERCLLN